MANFWLVKCNPIRPCSTFNDVSELMPPDGYASWNVKGLGAGAYFPDYDRVEVLELGGKILYRQLRNGKIVRTFEMFVFNDGTHNLFIHDAEEEWFLLKFNDPGYPNLKVLLQHYRKDSHDWIDHRPTLPEARSVRDPGSATLSADRLLSMTQPPRSTQEDEGGGYVP